MKSEQQYIELYQESVDVIRDKSCDVMNAVREEAFHRFCNMGFPFRKVERYRYTDVQEAFAPNYGIVLAPQQVKPSPYVFHLVDAPDEVAAYYNQVADLSDGITQLNTALATDAIVVYVGRNVRVENPIELDFWLNGTVPVMCNRRLLVVMEEGAEATLIIGDHGKSEAPTLATQVVEVVCKANANLTLFEIEDTTVHHHRYSNVYVRMERDSVVLHNSITLFNGHTRNLCDVYLNGENAAITLNGAAIATGNQHIDNNTLIDHRVPNCTSNELYKYVLDDKAVGAFAGKILVEKDAQKTNSQETNANLCASEEARMFTQPMLEIYADDVKCAHGATVGVMDEVALFYMRQRGISEEEARMLLKNAFLGQVIDQIAYDPLRTKLYVKIEKRFRGELEKCETCRLCK